MNQAEVEAFVEGLDNVQREEAYGYVFFFVGADHLLPFVTLANTDQEFDNVSNLSRPGVFRINIGVSRETYQNMIGEPAPEAIDYTLLNIFLPHPEYSRQHFICILSPSGDNVEKTKSLIVEAHGLAAARLQRKTEK
jgi:hypothetical protein